MSYDDGYDGSHRGYSYAASQDQHEEQWAGGDMDSLESLK